MTARGHLRVVDDASAQTRARISRDGRRIGNHAHRPNQEAKDIVAKLLVRMLREAHGDNFELWTLSSVPTEFRDWARDILGYPLAQGDQKVDYSDSNKMLQRIITAQRCQHAEAKLKAERAAAAREAGQTQPDEPDELPIEVIRLENLSLGARPRGRMFTPEQLRAVTDAPNPYQALQAERRTGGLFEGWATSTFYDAWDKIHPAYRLGRLNGTHGTPRQRRGGSMGAQQLHPPRASASRINEVRESDLYDLKTDLQIDYSLEQVAAELGVDLRGLTDDELGQLSLKAFPFVDDASGYITHVGLSFGDPTGELYAAHYGNSCVGHVVQDGTKIYGPALHFGSDQGTQAMSQVFRTRIGYVGTNSRPYASYTPTSNGRVERIQQDLGIHLRLNAGHHSGPFKRDGNTLANSGDTTAVSSIVNGVREWQNFENFQRVPRTGRYAGMTRFKRYKMLLERGDVVRLDVQDRHIARLAIAADDRERVSEPTKGVNFGGDGVYWQSLELAQHGADRFLVRVLPGRTDIAYVHTPDWSFACLVYRADLLPGAEADAITAFNAAQARRVAKDNAAHREWRRTRDAADLNIAAGAPVTAPAGSINTTDVDLDRTSRTVADEPVSAAEAQAALLRLLRDLPPEAVQDLLRSADLVGQPDEGARVDPFAMAVPPAREQTAEDRDKTADRPVQAAGPPPSTAPSTTRKPTSTSSSPRRPAGPPPVAALDPLEAQAAALEARRAARQKQPDHTSAPIPPDPTTNPESAT